MKTAKCPKCGNTYTMGVTGTVDGCDECQGIVRNQQGFAFTKAEVYDYQKYLDAEFKHLREKEK